MKRLVLLCTIALPLFGLTRPVTRGSRIGVLRMSDRYSYGAEQTVAKTIQNDLRSELKARGFQAFDTRATFEEVQRGSAADADYYVEIVSSRLAQRSPVSIASGIGPVGVDIGVVISRVGAELRLYDGRTMELVERYDLQQNRTAVVPTAIGVGGRSVWAFIAVPLMQYGQYRSAAHDVAREAADRIARR